MISTFRAQTLVHTNKTADGWLEMTFADQDGKEHMLALPQIIASGLVDVFEQIKTDTARPAAVGQFYKHVTSWRVGRTDHPSAVLLSLDDEPFRMMDGEDAMNLGGILRDVGSSVMSEGDGKPQ